MSSRGDLVYQFVNCRLLRNHQLVEDDLWVRAGKIINPEKLFFEEKVAADEQIDCGGMIISPGFIDVQINGAFGVDFSADVTDIEKGVGKVAKGLLEHGVTSFCPTLVTCSRQTYSEILPGIKKSNGGRSGAGVLGLHLEGPFINKEKKGAHNESFIREFTNGFSDVLEMYGTLDNTVIVTLAPEHERSEEVIKELVHRGIVVSVGHSTSNLIQGETAVGNGASFITHLFNAMLPFHHRDPHLIGLLTSKMIPSDKKVYYGLIADGIHTHPAALRIAHRVDPKGLVLVTDAIPAMGLLAGKHQIGSQTVEIKGKRAVIAGTNTLCGSIVTMDKCVRHLAKATDCGKVLALESASLHPAQLLGITNRKGTLGYNSDADFILVDDMLNIKSTYIAGELVWKSNDTET
ncbi:N-acetylglucosamine-6-phosphate deacetylase-like isoform X2 [Pecten maximus]|uniref:N-acetylglucosamine-6-phosphate deacetylase-like isoform X2 n=1 Tax=Pecten maximus TaxID=6579 RepID=UPI001458C51E|nr:N-acetylglucosamine-6-phosphate deacetylase-like isoform X2 [Pecten maximus]